jgi:hypothetical protein
MPSFRKSLFVLARKSRTNNSQIAFTASLHDVRRYVTILLGQLLSYRKVNVGSPIFG